MVTLNDGYGGTYGPYNQAHDNDYPGVDGRCVSSNAEFSAGHQFLFLNVKICFSLSPEA